MRHRTSIILLAIAFAGSASAGSWSLTGPKSVAPSVASVQTDTAAPVFEPPVRKPFMRAAPPINPPSDDPPTPPSSTIPTVSLPAALTVRQGRRLTITATTNCLSVSEWDAPDSADSGNLNLESLADRGKPLSCKVDSIMPGTYPVRAIVALDGVGAISNVCLVTVVPATPGPPQPPTPAPVGPTPGPVVPPPTPAPATAQKLTVIVVYDPTASTAPAVQQFLKDPYLAQGTGQLVPANALYRFGHRLIPYYTTSVAGNGPITQVYAQQIAAAKAGGIVVPLIFVFDAATMTWLNTNPADMALPSSAASLKALLSKFTSNI